jgi:hypothetical protein
MQMIQSILHPWSIQGDRSISAREKGAILALTIISSVASACIRMHSLPIMATLSFYTWTWVVKKFQANQNFTNWQTYQANYQLESTIEKIKALKLQNKKIHLLIGRAANEPLPQGGIKDTIWVSLDTAIAYSQNPLPKFDSSRLHLQIDFNHKGQMQKITDLFHEVIVDWSVMKFVDDSIPWRPFMDLLDSTDPDTRLITPTSIVGGAIALPAYSKEMQTIEAKARAFPWEILSYRYLEFFQPYKIHPIEIRRKIEESNLKRLTVNEDTQKYLEKYLFNDVILVNEPCLYRQNYSHNGNDYFILRHPNYEGLKKLDAEYPRLV